MVYESSPRWRSAPPMRTAYLVKPLQSRGPQIEYARTSDRATALGHAMSALRVGCVLSSSSRPARETAERIARVCGLHVMLDNRLGERRLVDTRRSRGGKTTTELVATSDVGGALCDALSYTSLRVVLVVDEHLRHEFLSDFVDRAPEWGLRGAANDDCVALEFVDDRWRFATARSSVPRSVSLAESRVR